jgi:hypothetical protein
MLEDIEYHITYKESYANASKTNYDNQKKIASIPNSINSTLLSEFCQYMKSNGASESHQNNNLKALISFAHFLGPNVSFYDIKQNDTITSFLDTKIKSLEEDPDKKCMITWNDYLRRIKYFIRWLYNYRGNDDASIHQSDWITPAFVRIKEKKTRRLSP